MYILDPIIVEKPWGVRPHLIKWCTGISIRRRKLVGELWIASGLKSLPGMANIVVNSDPDMSISDLLRRKPEKFLGRDAVPPRELCGKTEAWYVREVKGDVRTITGLREGIGKKKFISLIAEGFFEERHSFEELEREIFTTVRFEKGAFYVMLPGTLHTIYAPDKESHIVVDEMQQGFGDNALPILSKILFVSNNALSVQVHPSDKHVAEEKRKEILEQYASEPTVRVYDFGRGRRSQPRLAAELIGYGREGFIKTEPVTIEPDQSCRITYLGATKYFARELIELRRGTSCRLHDIGQRYYILHCVDGEGIAAVKEGGLRLNRGMTIAVPAWAESLEMFTKAGMLCYRDYLPDLSLLKRTLKSHGVSDTEIAGMIIETG